MKQPPPATRLTAYGSPVALRPRLTTGLPGASPYKMIRQVMGILKDEENDPVLIEMGRKSCLQKKKLSISRAIMPFVLCRTQLDYCDNKAGIILSFLEQRISFVSNHPLFALIKSPPESHH